MSNPHQYQQEQSYRIPSFVNTDLAVVAALLPTLATIAVVLRFIARRKKRAGSSRADDWVLWITLLLCWGHSINTLVAGAIGGFNYVKIDPMDFADVTLRTLWISGFFLITPLYTVKVSILLFYYNLFSINERFKLCVKIMLGILTAWFIPNFICQLVATEPIDASWDAQRAVHRFDFNAWYITYSGTSILFDIIILCFPLPLVKHLKVSRRQKFSIMGIFWLGGFVCVSAIVRFVLLYNSIYKVTDFRGPSQYNRITTPFIWAEVEPNTAVIAACLPTYGPLFADGKFGTSMLNSIKSIFIPSRFASSSSGSNLTSKKSGIGKEMSISNASSGGYHELDESIPGSPPQKWGKAADIENQRGSDDKVPLAQLKYEAKGGKENMI